MKNIKTLFIITLLCGIAFAFCSCQTNPTAGLDEISFEEIAKADLYDEYKVTTDTYSYDDEGAELSHTSTSGTATGDEVKATAAAGKLAIEAGKLLKTHEGRVCANKKYSKIVIYMYTKNSSGITTEKVITTYTKK